MTQFNHDAYCFFMYKPTWCVPVSVFVLNVTEKVQRSDLTGIIGQEETV